MDVYGGGIRIRDWNMNWGLKVSMPFWTKGKDGYGILKGKQAMHRQKRKSKYAVNKFLAE